MKNQIAKAANFNTGLIDFIKRAESVETQTDFLQRGKLIGYNQENFNEIDFDLIQAQKHERLRLFKDAQEKAVVEGRIKEIKIKEQNDRI